MSILDCLGSGSAYFSGIVADAAQEYSAPLSRCEEEDFVEIIIEALKVAGGLCLEYVSDKFQDNRKVVLSAVRDNGMALGYASSRLRGDRYVVKAAICQNRESLIYSRLLDDEETIMLAVDMDGRMLRLASGRLRDNKEIVLKAVSECPASLEYASERLQDDDYKTMMMSTPLVYKRTVVSYNMRRLAYREAKSLSVCLLSVDQLLSSLHTMI